MDEKVRLAVVGCGAVAAGHYLPSIAASRLVEATLLVDRDEARARALATRYEVPATSGDASAVAAHAEAAVLALPNHLHAPVAIDLLRQGIHVLVEKPMAISTTECDAMIEAAEASGAVLALGLQFRSFDSTALVAGWLASGLLGPLRRFELRLGVISRWQFASDFVLHRETAGGGVLTDYGSHVLDLLLHWLGDWHELTYRDDACGGVESDCELELTMASGLGGFVEISRSRNLANTCLFEGETGTLEVGIWDPDPPLIVRIGGEQLRLDGRARRGKSPGLTFNGAFLRSIDDFARVIRQGGEPVVSGQEGRRGVALIEACYAARQALQLPWSIPQRAQREVGTS
ncbi:MAG TPA: Gfo/Idh/MocA family oxidoreductase [Thermoanaerobaculia bacterium]|nr:Gfo/Idh/MocA family oxidoreductase [Thermoanaerobaculia bacterium]